MRVLGGLCLLALMVSVSLGDLVSDGFESGGFDTLAWQSGGDVGWVIDTENPNSGSYYARSGVMQPEEVSRLEITVRTNRIRFFARSYGMSGDTSRFLIDGDEVRVLNGGSWYEYDFVLAGGEHTFVWECMRVNIWSDGTGLMLDDIRFGMDLVGMGTADEPYEIYTAEEFNRIGQDNDFYCDKHFRLMADIDLEGYGHLPEDLDGYDGPEIVTEFHQVGGTYVEFQGHFDGNYHAISGLYYHSSTYPTDRSIGLFRVIGEHGVVENLIVERYDFSGYYTIAPIASENKGIIRGCSTYGTIAATGNYGNAGAGITAFNHGGFIEDCYADVVIRSTHGNVGGIAGTNSGGVIRNCEVDCDIVTVAGGISGIANNREGSKIDRCVVRGNLAGYRSVGGISSDNYMSVILDSASTCIIKGCRVLGGIAGSNSNHSAIIRCRSNSAVGASYGTVGGVVGANEGDSVVYGSYHRGGVYKLEVEDSNYEEGEFGTDGLYSAGGVAGINRSLVKMCYHSGLVANGSYTWEIAYNFSGTVESCLFEEDGLTYLDDYYSGMRRSEEAFRQFSTFVDAGWDMEHYWTFIDAAIPHIGFNQLDKEGLVIHLVDGNWDGAVDFADLLPLVDSFLAKRGEGAFNHLIDLNFDGIINLEDVAIFGQYVHPPLIVE